MHETGAGTKTETESGTETETERARVDVARHVSATRERVLLIPACTAYLSSGLSGSAERSKPSTVAVEQNGESDYDIVEVFTCGMESKCMHAGKRGNLNVHEDMQGGEES